MIAVASRSFVLPLRVESIRVDGRSTSMTRVRRRPFE
jgi:hypothetical protein